MFEISFAQYSIIFCLISLLTTLPSIHAQIYLSNLTRLFDPDTTPTYFVAPYSYTRYHLPAHILLHTADCSDARNIGIEDALDHTIDEMLLSPPSVQLYLSSMTLRYIQRPFAASNANLSDPNEQKRKLNLLDMVVRIDCLCLRSKNAGTRYQKWVRSLLHLPLTPLSLLFYDILIQNATAATLNAVHNAFNTMLTDLSLRQSMEILETKIKLDLSTLSFAPSSPAGAKMYSLSTILDKYSHLLEPVVANFQLKSWKKSALLIQELYKAQLKDNAKKKPAEKGTHPFTRPPPAPHIVGAQQQKFTVQTDLNPLHSSEAAPKRKNPKETLSFTATTIKKNERKTEL